MNLILGMGIFLLILFLIEAGYFSYRTIRNPEKQEVLKRLGKISTEESQAIDIARRRVLSEVPWINRMLLSLPPADKLHRLLEQANIQYPVGLFLLLSLLLALVGFFIGLGLFPGSLFSIILAIVLGTIPYLYIYLKKERRMKKFERQLPDAMDLIARALRAGHAFSSGLKMVADEFEDPIGIEFAKTLNEINFGVSLPDALTSLANRVDCPDLRFFVISVILQRETGGNLADILENIARLIRERFKLHGRIRILSAEGRLSAIVLVALPFFVALYIYFVNPQYIRLLIEDSIGRIITILALTMMFFGILTIKRMVTIKV